MSRYMSFMQKCKLFCGVQVFSRAAFFFFASFKNFVAFFNSLHCGGPSQGVGDKTGRKCHKKTQRMEKGGRQIQRKKRESENLRENVIWSECFWLHAPFALLTERESDGHWQELNQQIKHPRLHLLLSFLYLHSSPFSLSPLHPFFFPMMGEMWWRLQAEMFLPSVAKEPLSQVRLIG